MCGCTSSRCINIILLIIFIINMFKLLCSFKICLVWAYLPLWKMSVLYVLLTVGLSGRLVLQTPSYVSITEVIIYLWIAKTKQGIFFSEMGFALLSSRRFFAISFSICLYMFFPIQIFIQQNSQKFNQFLSHIKSDEVRKRSRCESITFPCLIVRGIIAGSGVVMSRNL